jgi:hypothetical protein
MLDRGFTEADLRTMMDDAVVLREADEAGRWLVETRHDSRSWHVIVEPDTIDTLLVVITAFPVENS